LVKLKNSGRVVTVRTPGLAVADAASMLGANAAVETAEPDFVYRAAAIPNDPDYAKQWYLPAAHFPAAWDFSKGVPSVNVAVLDTGVDLSHPDLKDRIWTNPNETANGRDDDGNGRIDDLHGWDFVDDDGDPDPVITPNASTEGVNHGTLVAGI